MRARAGHTGGPGSRQSGDGGTMRLLIGFAWLVLLSAAARAQTGVVDRIQIVRVGTWTVGDGDKLVPARVTEIVPAQIGSVFGVEWRAIGRPLDGTATVKVRWIYPEPGMRHPVTRSLRASDEYDFDVGIGAQTVTYLELHSGYMVIPGKWVLEIGQRGQTLLRQEFKMTP